MAGSPDYKVYSSSGKYLAACVIPLVAAPIAAALGNGTTIRWGHSKRAVLWTEGVDGFAGESFDRCASVCVERRDALLGR